MKRAGNNPKRRVAPQDLLSDGAKEELALRARYIGSGHHKRNPADYGLERTNPRPTKSLCDLLRTVPLAEAQGLLQQGINLGMVSELAFDGFPKFIWSVDMEGEVYEAKTDPMTTGVYHGYRLEEEDDMRDNVKAIWKQRCQPAGR
ncbi:hypothetical protein G8O24_09865 [Bradyrhizobium sp. INPA01-394B]|jgi:hypothetical protein|uniref:Uncharacterized protein n=2 Tax=Nitrobacteraceae TaxID=41294 RepID=K8NZT4_9BRAD|nr:MULTISPECIES: hypothetical protein [Nitrobacteraceae]MAH71110.1 hypothetical protein [Afipia sp.]MBX9822041.1 hypothetical protein [Afipia birgiae]OUX59762.1 MAG: hypothetical protein CBB64_17945 [Afipia sp. TMED4]EKS32935.1 hypothetical protein HMPREF9695_04950 [Afipia broomeae ATCC 49717]MBC9877647.1 hypothetical protein [Bradyrhizobium campsiandrae]|tara:strand:+ start:322 stop:759 length:438 start_codon:yes stop_codon:yes gene_type:complete